VPQENLSQLEPMLTVEELCRVAKISRSMGYRLVRQGVLPAAHGLGRCVRIPASAVRQLLAAKGDRHG
jgi:excisionase family DNA binding protein